MTEPTPTTPGPDAAPVPADAVTGEPEAQTPTAQQTSPAGPDVPTVETPTDQPAEPAATEETVTRYARF